jgi:hypothetical protein
LKVSVNEDEFTLNNILRFFSIYFEIMDLKLKKYLYDNKLKYSLNNPSLKTVESDSITKSELDDIFTDMTKLADDEFLDCFVTLKNKLPSQVLKDVQKMKNRLKRTLCRKDRKISGIYWLIYEPTEAPLIRLINTAVILPIRSLASAVLPNPILLLRHAIYG